MADLAAQMSEEALSAEAKASLVAISRLIAALADLIPPIALISLPTAEPTLLRRRRRPEAILHLLAADLAVSVMAAALAEAVAASAAAADLAVAAVAVASVAVEAADAANQQRLRRKGFVDSGCYRL